MKAVIQLPDDFEKGYCDECPFSYEEYVELDDDGYIESDYCTHCVFGYNWQECRLEIEE